MSEDVVIFSAEFGKLVKLEDYGLNNSEFFQIDIGNNKYGRVLVTILVGEKSSFYLRFFNKKIEEIRRQYWGIAPIDFPSEPWWYAAGPRLFERTEKEALKKAVDVLKENEEEPMSDEVKYYFKRTLRIFEFLLSNEGQKFIKENNIHRYNYQPGDIEEHKKIEKAIEEVYEQLNAILNQKEVWDEKDLGTV